MLSSTEIPDIKGIKDIKYLYLTTVGRITGQPRQIEIWFVESEGKLYILAEHFEEAQWVKNIKHNSRVRVRVGDRAFDGAARVLDPEHDREAWQTAQRLSNEKYGWGEGLPVEIVKRESNSFVAQNYAS